MRQSGGGSAKDWLSISLTGSEKIIKALEQILTSRSPGYGDAYHPALPTAFIFITAGCSHGTRTTVAGEARELKMSGSATSFSHKERNTQNLCWYQSSRMFFKRMKFYVSQSNSMEYHGMPHGTSWSVKVHGSMESSMDFLGTQNNYGLPRSSMEIHRMTWENPMFLYF